MGALDIFIILGVLSCMGLAAAGVLLIGVSALIEAIKVRR